MVPGHESFSGLLQTHTFGPAEQSIGNVIDTEWLFSWKSDELGWISKAKSRLVARELKQREGIDLERRSPYPHCFEFLCAFIECDCLRA